MSDSPGLADGEQVIIHFAVCHAGPAPLDGLIEADAGASGAQAGEACRDLLHKGARPAGDAQLKARADQSETFDGRESRAVEGSEISKGRSQRVAD